MAEEKTRLPDAELEVMQALWAQREYPASSAQIAQGLDGRSWRLATLLKLLSRLEERGFVAREKEGRGNLYRPLVAREDYLAAESRSFLERLHGGSLPSLVAALVESEAVRGAELDELRALLARSGEDGGT